MSLPAPERGWELIHEFAETIPDPMRACFIAEVRNAEGMFTSGLVTEFMFRELLAAAKVTCEQFEAGT